MSSERSEQRSPSSSFEEACAAIHAHSMAVLMSVVPSETFSHTIRQREANTGNSLLHVAALADFSGALRYLILQCNHHVRTTKDGYAPLVPSEVISLQNNEGKTALHIAMQRGNITVITVLRDASERLKILEELCEIKDRDGNTIMDVAASPDLQALIAVGLDRYRACKYPLTAGTAHTSTAVEVPNRHSSPEPSPPANRQDSSSKSNPRVASLKSHSTTATSDADETPPSPPRNGGAVRSSVSPTHFHSSPSTAGRYNNNGLVGSAAASMDGHMTTTTSPQVVASSHDLQQILAMQQRMMSILEHLPQSTVTNLNTSSSTASSSPLRLHHGSGATQLTTITSDPDPLSDTFSTAEGISNRRLLHMLVLAGESSERHAVERDCLKSYLSITDRYHLGTKKLVNGERMIRRVSQLVTPSPPATLLPIISTQQFRAESETGSTGQCSSRSATSTYHPHPTCTQSYGSGLRSTVSTKDAATCTSDRPLLTDPTFPEKEDNNDNNNNNRDRMNRSVLMVHGERHVAGQEVDLLIQWRGEEGADDWAPLSEVSDYAVVQAYLARKRGPSSSTGNYGSPISSAGGFARMGSPLGETERDDLSNQLAALQRVSTGGGLESGGQMGLVGGDGGGMIQWCFMQPPALETLFDRGRMEPSFVAIQSDLLMAAIACQDIGTSQTPTAATSAGNNGAGYSPVGWNRSAPSSAGFFPPRSNLTPIQGAHVRRRNPSSNYIVHTPLGFGKGPAVVRHSSELRRGIQNSSGSRAASSPMTSKRVSRELPPRRNHQVVLPPSRGLLPEEYQTTDLQDVDEVLPPPPQRAGRGGNNYSTRGYPPEGGRAVSPQELLRALDHAEVGSDDDDLASPYDDDLAGNTTRLTRTPTERETETILSHFTEKMRNLELRHQACKDRAARSGAPTHPSGIPRPLQIKPYSSSPTAVNVSKKLLEPDNVVSDSGEAVDDDDGSGINNKNNDNYEEVLQDEEQEEARQSWRSLDSSEASDIRNMLGSDDQDVPDEEEELLKEIDNNKTPLQSQIKPPESAITMPETTKKSTTLPIKYDQQFVYRGKGGKRSLSPSANMLADGHQPTILQSSMDGESSIYTPPETAAPTGAIPASTTTNVLSPQKLEILKSSSPTTSTLQGRRANSEVTIAPTSRIPAAPRASTALPPIITTTGTPLHLPPALKGGNAPRSTPGSAIGGTRQVRFESSNPPTPDDSKLPWIPRYGAPPPSRPSRLAPLD